MIAKPDVALTADDIISGTVNQWPITKFHATFTSLQSSLNASGKVLKYALRQGDRSHVLTRQHLNSAVDGGNFAAFAKESPSIIVGRSPSVGDNLLRVRPGSIAMRVISLEHDVLYPDAMTGRDRRWVIDCEPEVALKRTSAERFPNPVSHFDQ